MKKTLLLILFSSVLYGCGGGGGSSGSVVKPPIAVSNVQPVTIENGSQFVGNNTTLSNILYTSVNVCVHGTTNCTTIDHVLVDTGSSGLRLLAYNIPTSIYATMPYQTDPLGNTISECAIFADGATWGAVKNVDIQIAGESASNIPVQMIGDITYGGVPTACSSTGLMENNASTLGANGIIGIANYKEDCGSYCSQTVGNGYYYGCNSSSQTCTQEILSLANQVQNPVFSFPVDNNGVIVQIDAASQTGQNTGMGQLFFGVGTQSNNQQFGTFYTQNSNYNISSTYNGIQQPAIFDTGSSAYFFYDPNIPLCANGTSFYCPASSLTLNVGITGYSGTSSNQSFLLENAETSYTSQGYGVKPGLGVNSGSVGTAMFDFGLPFFFGKSVGFSYNNNGNTGVFF